MFNLYCNNRKNQFPWEFDILDTGDFNNLVSDLFDDYITNKEKVLRIEIDYTANLAEVYTEDYIFIVR